ncbi:hypothetical protein M513_12029 [Trichuris suis]|uniref:GIY-YIG domain-containing protein n=1 Tax=Trichuris suis TaxID=68888 RepID=A0A085LQ73_9BILA|nr:hypothetical protein M513_12029 [Trichuris suis]
MNVRIDRKLTNQNCSKIGQSAPPQLDQSAPAITSRSANLGSTLRCEKVKPPLDQRPGAVYQITCTCGALYIGETANSVSHRFVEHLRGLTRYRNPEARHMGLDVTTRGRPQTLEPASVMQ